MFRRALFLLHTLAYPTREQGIGRIRNHTGHRGIDQRRGATIIRPFSGAGIFHSQPVHGASE
jgi:hypothetical protein